MENWKKKRNYHHLKDENGKIIANIITVDGVDVEVTKEVFLAYSQADRRERYISEESMLEGMAEYYSVELSVKIHRGQKENALKGRNNGGSIPLGYQLNKETQKLEINESTAPIVREMFQRYAAGDTIKDIRDDFNKRGLTTNKGFAFKYSTFSTVLKNRKYIGEYKYQDVVIPDGLPAIVPKDVFDRVQMRLKKNQQAPAMAKASDKYLLTTKLFCGKCGRMMAGESGKSHTGKTYYYYKCGNAKKKNGCDKKAVKKEWIENLVVQQTMLMLADDVLIKRLVNRLLELQGEESFDLRRLQEQLNEVEKGIENMLNAIQAGIITASTKERLTALETQKAQIEESILREKVKHPILTREQIEFFLRQFRNTDTDDEEARQRLIDCFVNAVFVYDDKIVLTFNYKDGTKTISLDDIKGSDLDSFGPP